VGGALEQTQTIAVRVSDTRAVVAASAVGTIMEWYDFALYGAAAALFINRLYFPNVSPTIGSLAAFATLWYYACCRGSEPARN
jgi:MHS family shikimate/dehydroshikimate transporter-like MFS transporter